MKYFSCVMIGCLVFLSGCSRYINWGNDVLHQACEDPYYRHVTLNYIRSERIYDQLTTLGLFDVLWLSDEVRGAYSADYASRHGYSQECYQMFLRRQLTENDHAITFYVLAYVPHAHGGLLTDANTMWTTYLAVDGCSYAPLSIKEVELDAAYQHFFGRLCRRFKTSYCVTFPACDVEGRSLMHDDIKNISLYFHTPGKVDECVQWRLDKMNRLWSRSDLNNLDILAYDMR